MKYNDKILLISMLILLIFLSINFDQKVSNIFIGFAIVSLFFHFIDTNIRFPTERTGSNRFTELTFTIISYGLFILVSTVVIGLLSPVFGFLETNVFSTFNASTFSFFSSNNPVLNDPSIPLLVLGTSFLVWVIVIPYLETEFIARIFEFIGDKVNAKFTLTDIKTWAVAVLVSALFVFLHLTAKGLTNNTALVLVFIFSIVSLGMIVYFKQTVEAKLLHMIANGVAFFRGLGIITENILVILIPVGIVLFIHFTPAVKSLLRTNQVRFNV